MGITAYTLVSTLLASWAP